MSINTSVYGTSYSDDLQGRAKTTTKSLYGFVIDDALPLNALPDASPCYCGMANDNYLINAIVCKADKTFMPLYKNVKAAYPWFLMRNYANPILQPDNQMITSYNQPSNRWAKLDSVLDLASYCSEHSNHFIFNLQLNKLLFIPYVKCSDTNDINGTDYEFTLGEYEASQHTTYPYITGAYMKPYYNDGTDESPQWYAARYSSDDYIFTTPIVELSDDIQNNSTDYIAAFSLISSINARDAIPIMGFGETPKRDIADSGFIYNPIGIDPDTTHYIYNDPDNPTKIKYCRAYSDDAIKDIWKQIAYYGVFFLGAGAGSWDNVKLTNNRVFCGTIDADGITHGDYTRGADNAKQPQFNWTDTSESNYDPTRPVDDNIYNGAFHTGALLAFDTATDIYNVSSANFQKLVPMLWDALALIPAGDPLNEYCLDTFLTQNPIDSIVALKYFPIKETMSWGTATTIKLGKFDTNIPCMPAQHNIIVDCGTKTIFPRFGKGFANWLDKLTTITLYLPFCGTLQLDPEIYMGRAVNVEYAIDLHTGNCSAFVSITADNDERCITDIANGSCGIDCPVTGIQHITLDSQLYNATEQLKAMRINNAVNGLTSLVGLTKMNSNDVSSAVTSIANTGVGMYNMIHSENVAEYNLQHTQLPVKMIGTTGATTGAMCDLYPIIILERPYVSDVHNDEYAKTNGYACCISDKVKNFTGYTEFANIELSGFGATATEKNAIMSALKGGVII